MNQQLELLRPEMQKVDTGIISRQQSFTAALILCQTLSGLEDKELCGPKGVINAPATWSRIKAGDNHFPQDSLNRYMDLCGNEAPLIWLASSRGYNLVPKESEWEQKARVEREEKERLATENALLRDLLTKRA